MRLNENKKGKEIIVSKRVERVSDTIGVKQFLTGRFKGQGKEEHGEPKVPTL